MDEAKTLALFLDLLEVEADERETWLEQNVGKNPDLQRRLQNLLEAAAEEDDGPLSRPLELPVHDEQRLGSVLGNYRLDSVLGIGGMGAVYLAERVDDIDYKAAVKVLRAGALSETQQRRFQAERRLLATLNHANIAHFLDAGTSEQGEPFLVMEYVEGLPITQYCRRHELPVRKILEITLELCNAIETAHRALLVHADIKPSNVLVREDGAPKLLDFGIANLAGASPDTEGFVHALTPGYASPEQLRNETLSVASDIYSLGMLLYHVLVGKLPHPVDGASVEETLGTVTSTPLPAASAVQDAATPGLDRELDAILSKALEPRIDDRYADVSALSADIRAYLERRPVGAFSEAPLYRLAKLLQRRKLTAAAVVLGAFALMWSWGETLVQSQVARVEAREARQQRDRAEASAEFLRGLFQAPNTMSSDATRPDIKVIDVLDQAAEAVRTDASLGAEDRLQLQSTLADLYQNMHQFDLAISLADESVNALETLDQPPALLAGRTLRVSALARMNAGDYSSAVEHYEEALLRIHEAHKSTQATAAYRDLELSVRTEYSQSLFAIGRCEQVEQQLAPNIEAAMSPTIEDLSRAERNGLVGVLNLAAICKENTGNTEDAYRLMSRARDIYALDQRQSETMSTLEHNLATMSLASGQWQQALQHLDESLRLIDALGLPPGSEGLGTGMAAFAHAQLGETAETHRLLERGRIVLEELPPDHPWRSGTLAWLGRASAQLGEHREAAELFERAITIDERARPEHQFLATYSLRLARSYRALGRIENAKHAYETAQQRFRESDFGDGIATVERELGELLGDQR